MTQEWKDLPTLQDVAAAQAAGEEIELYYKFSETWHPWDGTIWEAQSKYRSRPVLKTRTIVLREAVCRALQGPYWLSWFSEEPEHVFVKWTGNERTEEVPE
jgi:hypothetical protein